MVLGIFFNGLQMMGTMMKNQYLERKIENVVNITRCAKMKHFLFINRLDCLL